jgi:hypothetical protein
MVKVNGEEVEWERHPHHRNNVYRHILWRDEKTGATLALLKIEKGELIEQLAHRHPYANQYTFQLSGRTRSSDGREGGFSEGDYGFRFYSKNEAHAGTKGGGVVLEDRINLEFLDGPVDWVNQEGDE